MDWFGVFATSAALETNYNTISSIDLAVQCEKTKILTYNNNCDTKGWIYSGKPDVKNYYIKLFDYLSSKEYLTSTNIGMTALSGGTDKIVSLKFNETKDKKEFENFKTKFKTDMKNVNYGDDLSKRCFTLNADALFDFLKTYKKNPSATWFLGGKKRKQIKTKYKKKRNNKSKKINKLQSNR